MSKVQSFEEGLSKSTETTPEKRKFKFSPWAISNIPENVRINLRLEQIDFTDSDPASFLMADLDRLNTFVATVNGSAALTAAIPAYLGGAGAVLTAGGLMTSLVTDAVIKSGRGAGVMHGTLVAPNTTAQLLLLNAGYCDHMTDAFFQAVFTVNNNSLPLAQHFLLPDKALTPTPARVRGIQAGIQDVYN